MVLFGDWCCSAFVVAAVVSSVSRFFFFQAEDGIRDIGVTGVQTCALPISPDVGGVSAADPHPAGAILLSGTYDLQAAPPAASRSAYFGDDPAAWAARSTLEPRSEERRGGKECIFERVQDTERRIKQSDGG